MHHSASVGSKQSIPLLGHNAAFFLKVHTVNFKYKRNLSSFKLDHETL